MGPPLLDVQPAALSRMQGDLFTTHAIGTKGHQAFSHERGSDELPTYYKQLPLELAASTPGTSTVD